VYFLPAIVARKRGSVSFVGIFLVNLLAGATGVFWLVALVWA
jgi:Superinfection immunity protein